MCAGVRVTVQCVVVCSVYNCTLGQCTLYTPILRLCALHCTIRYTVLVLVQLRHLWLMSEPFRRGRAFPFLHESKLVCA